MSPSWISKGSQAKQTSVDQVLMPKDIVAILLVKYLIFCLIETEIWNIIDVS